MNPEPSPWRLKEFIEHIDIWIGLEKPDVDLRIHVLAWAMRRDENPYQGARRESGFPNLWFAPVPQSNRNGQIVICITKSSSRCVRCAARGSAR
ncbi:hypothetical protein GCM10010435_89930 [Winogradskya consettensis]|uniref:Uncharacterized protein n=1 Tax=Winogradskya consettensis TaxID=113560 RepID=A0A919VWQ1_9ACTN|nr:hypothetical protein Aco04nite_57260 [Actinoplanes consettensis]